MSAEFNKPTPKDLGIRTEDRIREPGSESLLKGEPWRRFYNPVVMEVFLEAADNPDATLFGVTGDLDNLGVHVARFGRPEAEILVDAYNQVTRNALEEWEARNRRSLYSVAFVPSGEECQIIGLARDPSTPQSLFTELRPNVMRMMHDQPYVNIGGTAASFGGLVFNHDYGSRIKAMAKNVNQGKDDTIVIPQYLDIIRGMRKELAVELDRQKFKNLLEGRYPVEFRQFVLTRMLAYKKGTKQLLESIPDLPESDRQRLLGLLGTEYGIDETRQAQVDEFLQQAATIFERPDRPNS